MTRWRPHRPDPAPLLEPRSVAVVGATDRPGSYGDTVLRNLERAGFAGRSGALTRRGRACTAGPACRRRRSCRSRSTRSSSRFPPPRCRRRSPRRRSAAAAARSSSPPASARSPGGASLERELAEVAGQAGIPVCGPNGNGVISVAARAPLWGDSVPELRARARRDDHPERQPRGQRARLAPRHRLPHARLRRQPGRARRGRLARRGGRAGRGPLDRALPRGGRRRRAARGSARPAAPSAASGWRC